MSLLRRRSVSNGISNSGRSAKSGTVLRFRKTLTISVLLATVAWFGVPRIWLFWQLSTARRGLSNGNPEAAIERLQRTVAAAPNAAEAQYRLAVAQRRAGHLGRVQVPLEIAKKLGWNKDDIERQMLLTTAQNGDVDAVDAKLKSIMARGASDEAAQEVYEALAIGFLKTYRLREAWDCLNYWGDWQPKAIFPKFWRADICRRIVNPAAEEREYRDILAIDPQYVNARSRLAEVLKDSNRLDEAAREYELSLKQAPNRPEIIIGYAECQRRLGHVAKAISLLQSAMELNLSNVERAAALTQLGVIEADAGDWNPAIKHQEQAVELAPFEAPTLFALSQAYASSGQEQKSRDTLERSKRVRSQRDRIDEIARILIDQPGSADLRYEAGKILMDLGMQEDGVAWLQTAIKMQPNHSSARDAIDVYEREKNGASQLK
jgi:tetratricopeptide (TPR) repeat protein